MAARILLISTNRESAPQPTLPVGAARVAEALKNSGFNVKFLDLFWTTNPLRELARALRDFPPDGVGISIRNLDTCDFLAPHSFLPEIETVVTLLKSATDAPILIGGSGTSIMPRQLLNHLQLDYAVAGPGEGIAPLFFRARTTEERRRIPGIICRHGSSGCCRHVPVPEATPRISSWIDTGRYLRFEPAVPVQGKRGCANRCLYCTYPTIEGAGWQPREPAAVVAEIAALMATTPAREFEFVDSIFNQPEGYLELLLEELIREGVRCRLHISSLSPRGLTGRELGLMARAGVVSVCITPEAAADETLLALRKDFTAADVHHAAELFAASPIRALWCFLLGGPQESAATLATTGGFINRISRKDRAFITTGVRIFPGTGLEELAVREGVLDRRESLVMPAFYFSPRLPPEQARLTLLSTLAEPRRCIFLTDTRRAALTPLRRLGTLLRLPSPFWRYAGSLGRVAGGTSILWQKWPMPGAPGGNSDILNGLP